MICSFFDIIKKKKVKKKVNYIKKEEAMKIAPEKSKLLCEYITQLLSGDEKVNGEIRISSDKTNNERMIFFDISVPSKDLEEHSNTGITTQQVDVLTGQILNDLIDNFMESENLGCTRYNTIRGGYGMNMDGINVMNSVGGKIKIDFVCRGNNFSEQVQNYNLILEKYVNQQLNNTKLNK